MLKFQRAQRPTRALITGGMGFIGSHLAEALLEDGQQVTVADNLATGRFENIQHLLGHPNFYFAVDDISNSTVIDRLVSESDVVYHLAATVGVHLIVNDPIHTLENNVLGTESVLKAAVRYRTKVFLASTSEVYGKGHHVPFAEDDDVVLGPTSRSRWSYAASKMVDEFMGLAYYQQKGLPVVIFRFFNTVGPRQTGQYGMVIPRFVQQALRGEPLTVYGDGEQSRCFLHVQDAVAAVMALTNCRGAEGQVFNVGSSEEVSIRELANEVLRLTAPYVRDKGQQGSMEERIRFVPYEEAYATGFEDMRRRVPDTSKLRRYTGWEPQRNLQNILEDVIEDFTFEQPLAAAA